MMGPPYHAKGAGGWGILNIEIFGKSLLMRSMWRSIHNDGIWRDIIRYKYMKLQNLEEAYLCGWRNKGKGSQIWKGFTKIWPSFREHLKWSFGKSQKIMIREVSIRGFLVDLSLGEQIINFLHKRGFLLMTQVIQHWQDGIPIWYDVEALGLQGSMRLEWMR